MNLCDFLFAHLLFTPATTPYGRPSEAAGWELDDSNWSPMNVGDWLAVNEETAQPHGHLPHTH